MDKDKWPGDFFSGDFVVGSGGVGHGLKGVVATKRFCLGKDESQEGQELRNVGIQDNLIPVIFEKIGCFWCSEFQLKRGV